LGSFRSPGNIPVHIIGSDIISHYGCVLLAILYRKQLHQVYVILSREWVFFSVDILVFSFTLLSVVNTYRMHGKFRFEILPLSVNCLATFMILLLQLFERGFEYYLATYLIEIYTYFLFCYTFTMMYVRVKQPQRIILIKKYILYEYRVSNIVFAAVTILVLLLTVLVFSTAMSANCE
jgi:hypothetical protein